jgi:hypothetical protein
MTIRRLLGTLALAVVGLAAWPTSSAYACSCAVAPGADPGELAEATFWGDVLDRREDGHAAVYVVRVERVWSGDVPALAEVHTSSSGASCGLELPASGPAVFYAEQGEGGRLSAMLCSGTGPAERPPAALGEGHPPKAGPAAPTSPSASASPGATATPDDVTLVAEDPEGEDGDGIGTAAKVGAGAGAVSLAGAALVVVRRRRAA